MGDFFDDLEKFNDDLNMGILENSFRPMRRNTQSAVEQEIANLRAIKQSRIDAGTWTGVSTTSGEDDE